MAISGLYNRQFESAKVKKSFIDFFRSLFISYFVCIL